jgi:hypothetical protein
VGCEPLVPEHTRGACFLVSPQTGGYAWHLANPRRARTRRKPIGHPQPSFFTPF